MIFTNFREIDKLGRIVISKDIRKHLDIQPGDMLMINAEGDTITIRKAENKCVFCNTTENLWNLKASIFAKIVSRGFGLCNQYMEAVAKL